MAFRRQDIPKTTRKPEGGGPRRIYPRDLRDRSILPKVDLAIDYLDGMIGRKRGELSPDMLLDLFGDPKLARCLLACMNEHYVYRTSSFDDAIGPESAAALLNWGICTPADLRGHLYLAANAGRGGFIAAGEREAFFAETGDALGLSGLQVEALIHLDAERNAILTRIGPRPNARDVVARYNVQLTLSTLRHASTITLDLPGLAGHAIDAVCARHEVVHHCLQDGTIQLAGRKSAMGTWSGFGARLARCAVHLLVLSPTSPSGEARVHFGDQSYRFQIDAKSTAALRPKMRVAAADAGMRSVSALADDLTQHRRETGDLAGWRIRRWPDPVVTEGVFVLPEIAFTRGHVTVAALPVTSTGDVASTIAALTSVNSVRPVLALGVPTTIRGLPTMPGYDPADLAPFLDEIAIAAEATLTPIDLVADELDSTGWLTTDRLLTLLKAPTNLERALLPVIARGATFVPGFGLCRSGLIDELRKPLSRGPVDIAQLRRSVASRVGESPAADALTLHLLSHNTAVSNAASTPEAA
ncbi:MAG: DUF790 family protein [Thermomicrobiales bacterium]|nr:DUF790 family protein [Thermomicrobiales bacterium]